MLLKPFIATVVCYEAYFRAPHLGSDDTLGQKFSFHLRTEFVEACLFYAYSAD